MKNNLLLLLLFCTLNLTAQRTQKRIALVIGNEAYKTSPLKNPVSDANLMEATLKDLNFEVIKRTNVTLRQLQDLAVDFNDKITNYDVALFYYAGHGIQVNGKNYLIPVDATLATQSRVRYEAFNIQDINDAFALNRKKVNIMILDACRDNPFRSWMRNIGGNRGFKSLNRQSAGTIIAFATREGETAADGTGNNGIFTKELVKQLKVPQNITEVFQNTRAAVIRATDYAQVPQEWNMLNANFAFLSPFSAGTLSEGSLLIDSEAEGDLYIDGRYHGTIRANTSNNRVDRLFTGTHTVELRGKNETLKQEVNISPNEDVYIRFRASVLNNKPINNPDRETTTNTARGLPKMVFVQGGSCTMGCNDGRDKNCSNNEKPAHQVYVSDFYIGRYEVTVAEYLKFVDETNSHYPEWLEEGNEYHIETGTNDFYKKKGNSRTASNLPIVGVSWNDAVAYCKWLSNKTNDTYRLLTEAEWEYVARGGNNQNNYKYAGGNAIDKVAWYSKNSDSKTHSVGQKQGLRIGNEHVFDLSGNVWEWCADHWHNNYEGAPTNGSAWTSGGDNTRRVVRGGSWLNYSTFCRVADRFGDYTVYRINYIGFRVARY